MYFHRYSLLLLSVVEVNAESGKVYFNILLQTGEKDYQPVRAMDVSGAHLFQNLRDNLITLFNLSDAAGTPSASDHFKFICGVVLIFFRKRKRKKSVKEEKDKYAARTNMPVHMNPVRA